MNDGDSPACFVAYQQARLTHMHPIPVTRGNGRQCFCLFVPIWFAEIHTLKGFETGFVTLPGRSVSVRTVEHSLIVQVREFETEGEAKSCFEEIRTAVLRAVASRRASAHVAPLGDIERGRGPISDGFTREVYEPWPPRTPETDGIIWRTRSYVLPDHERILLMPSATARIIREVSPSVLTDWFRSRVTPQKWPLSDKDELALAVAAEANAQRSPKLEFLGLVNALEVLIEEKVRTQAQEQFIGRWKCEIDEATIKAQEKNEAGLADELAEIRKRLDFNSIQGGLRRIFEGVAAAEVLDPAVNVGFKAVDDLGRAVSAIYAVRSELTHSGRVRDKGDVAGSIRLQEAASVARYLVYCALFDRLK